MRTHRMREILLNADKDVNAFDEIWVRLPCPIPFDSKHADIEKKCHSYMFYSSNSDFFLSFSCASNPLFVGFTRWCVCVCVCACVHACVRACAWGGKVVCHDNIATPALLTCFSCRHETLIEALSVHSLVCQHKSKSGKMSFLAAFWLWTCNSIGGFIRASICPSVGLLVCQSVG